MVGNEQYGADKSDEEKGDYRFCQCFNIHKSLASYIREKLNADGITREYIYPTVDIDTSEIFTSCKNTI
ncbi:MAG: hypothetical protein EOP48_08125 [Sphingobacteriales bacterium]|nr:MAG: hypothetical protein EOP48_08125 [Sphingobacteriales bacterium]